jgi:ribosomal protein S18 acetylase RimI-like enzyme
MNDLDRAFAFARWLQERTSTRVEPFPPWGSALFNDGIPERYFSNFVRVEGSPPGVDVDALVRDTDRALAGFRHRQIQVFDDLVGARIAPGLAKAGYSAEHSAMMALRRSPDRAPSLDAVEEVAHFDARPFLLEVYRRSLPDAEQHLVEAFADFRRVVQRAVGGRFFAQRIEGSVAGLCELYVLDDIAQVEHVDTLSEFRGRGVARNVVLRAVHEARAAGADLVLIEADLDDWPKELYRRLGFGEIGRSWAFTRAPGQRSRTHPRPKGDRPPARGPPPTGRRPPRPIPFT